MMDTLRALESTGLATWIREGNTIWAYPTILTLHTVGLALLVGANWAFALRLLGFADAIPLDVMAKSFRVMWIGFWINALSGIGLFIADASTKGATRLFVSKLVLVFVGVAVILATRRAVYAEGAPRVTAAARALATASIVIWVVAIAAGRLMAYL